MGILGWVMTGLVLLGGTLIVSAGLGNVVVRKDAAANRVLISQITPADARVLSAMKDYYAADKNRCPQVKYEPATLQKWPRLPAVMAGIKFALTQDQGWKDDPKTRGARDKLLELLDDPNFKIEFSAKAGGPSEDELLERTARGEDFASGQPIDDHTIRLGPTSDFNRYGDQKDPKDPAKVVVKREDTGLAISVLHELYHVMQLRENPKLSNLHGNPKTERPAYAFSGSTPPLALLRAGDAFYQSAATAACPQLRAALPPGTQTGSTTQSLVLVIDASGSMAGQRLADAKRAATDLLTNQVQPGSEVALVVYSDCKQISWDPFTTQPKMLIPKVEAIKATGNTDMSGALRVAEAHLSGGEARGATGAVVLLSDGDDNCGGNPVDAARSLASKRVTGAMIPSIAPAGSSRIFASTGLAYELATKGEIRLHTVGFQVSSTAEKQLREMSVAGNGSYYPATNLSDLSQALGSAVVADLFPEHEPVPATPLALKEKTLNLWGGLVPLGGGAGLAVGAVVYAFTAAQGRRATGGATAVPLRSQPFAADSCPACGAPRAGTRFCIRCGAALPETPADPVQAAEPSCSQCGAGSMPGERFCSRCGSGLAHAANAGAGAASCGVCGAQCGSEDRFCQACGAQILLQAS